MGGRFGRMVLALGVATILGPGTVAAQGRPLSARGQQDLQFGPLLPGVPITVSRLDAANAGQFEIRGRRNTEVQVELTLPAVMTSGSGATLPLQFSAGDAGYSTDPAIGSSQAFDPRVPLTTVLASNGKLYIFLGGTALPGSQQAAGTYAATITLTVAYTGV